MATNKTKKKSKTQDQNNCEEQKVKKEVQDLEDDEEQTLNEDEQDPGNKFTKGKQRRGKQRKRTGCNQRRSAILVLTSAGGDALAEEGSLRSLPR